MCVTCGCWSRPDCLIVRWAPHSPCPSSCPGVPCASSRGPLPPRHRHSSPTCGRQKRWGTVRTRSFSFQPFLNLAFPIRSFKVNVFFFFFKLDCNHRSDQAWRIGLSFLLSYQADLSAVQQPILLIVAAVSAS